MTESTPFTNSYANFVPEVWSKKLNTVLEKSCVMLQCVNRNYEGDIKEAGDTVNIITPPDVTVSTLTGDALSYSELAPSTISLMIDQRKLFAFKINDVAKAQANQDIMEAYLVNAKKAIEVAQDTYLLALQADVPSSNIHKSGSTVAITPETVYSEFVALAKLLKKSNAISAGQKPWVVINPDVEAILLESAQFTNASQLGAETLREGSIGKVAGMDVLVSTNLTAASGGNIVVLAGTNDAITFASQLAKIETIRDQNSFSDIVRGLYLYGAKTVVPTALAKMTVTCTAP